MTSCTCLVDDCFRLPSRCIHPLTVTVSRPLLPPRCCSPHSARQPLVAGPHLVPRIQPSSFIVMHFILLVSWRVLSSSNCKLCERMLTPVNSSNARMYCSVNAAPLLMLAINLMLLLHVRSECMINSTPSWRDHALIWCRWQSKRTCCKTGSTAPGFCCCCFCCCYAGRPTSAFCI